MSRKANPQYDYSFIKKFNPSFYNDFNELVDAFKHNYIASIKILSVALFEKGFKYFLDINGNLSQYFFRDPNLSDMVFTNNTTRTIIRNNFSLNYDLIKELRDAANNKKHDIEDKEFQLEKKDIIYQLFSYYTQLYEKIFNKKVDMPNDDYLNYISSFNEYSKKIIDDLNKKSDKIDKEIEKKENKKNNIESDIENAQKQIQEKLEKLEDISDEYNLVEQEYKKLKQDINLIKTEKIIDSDNISNNNANLAKSFISKKDFETAEMIYNRMLNVDLGDIRAYFGLILCLYKAEDINEIIKNASTNSINLRDTQIFKDSKKFLAPEKFEEIENLAYDIDNAISFSVLETAIINNDFEVAKKELNYLEGRDHSYNIIEHKLFVNNEPIYQDACTFKESKNYKEAIKLFEKIKSYKDTPEQIKLCKTEYKKIKEEEKAKEEERRLEEERKAKKAEEDRIKQLERGLSIINHYYSQERYNEAIYVCKKIMPYGDSQDMYYRCCYELALQDKLYYWDRKKDVLDYLVQRATEEYNNGWPNNAIKVLHCIEDDINVSELLENCIKLKDEIEKKEENKFIESKKEIGLIELENHNYDSAKKAFDEIKYSYGLNLVEKAIQLQSFFGDYLDGNLTKKEYLNYEKQYSEVLEYTTYIDSDDAISLYYREKVNKLLEKKDFEHFLMAFDLHKKSSPLNSENQYKNCLNSILLNDGLKIEYLKSLLEDCAFKYSIKYSRFIRNILYEIVSKNTINIPFDTAHYICDNWANGIFEQKDRFDLLLKKEAENALREEMHLKAEQENEKRRIINESISEYKKNNFQYVIDTYEKYKYTNIYDIYLSSLFVARDFEKLKQYNIWKNENEKKLFIGFLTSDTFKSFTMDDKNNYLRSLVHVYNTSPYLNDMSEVLYEAVVNIYNKSKNYTYKLLNAGLAYHLDFLYPNIFAENVLFNIDDNFILNKNSKNIESKKRELGYYQNEANKMKKKCIIKRRIGIIIYFIFILVFSLGLLFFTCDSSDFSTSKMRPIWEEEFIQNIRAQLIKLSLCYGLKILP